MDPFYQPFLAPPPPPQKPSILDRLTARLFPTAQYTGLLDPSQQQGLSRQGLLNVGLNLLQAGAPSAHQAGTLANLGSSIQNVNFPEMAQQAMQLQAYKSQQAEEKAVQQVAARHPAVSGESQTDVFNRLSAMAVEAAALGPQGEAFAAKLAPIITALKPERAPTPQQITGIVDRRLGSPTLGQTGTFLIPYPGAPKEAWTFVQGKPEKSQEPTPVERVAGSQYQSASTSVANMEAIVQRNPEAAKAAVAAIRAGGWGKLGQAYSELRGYTSDPDAQQFYTDFNNALLSFSPIYGGTRTTTQILQLEKAAVLPALGSGDFASAFAHLHGRLRDLQAKAGKALATPAAGSVPQAPGNPFRTPTASP